MNKRRITALVCAVFLAFALPGLAEEDGFGTYVQPEGVTVCAQGDLRYFDAPAGLTGMYDLMSTGNAQADVYLFLMPNGLGLVSVARKDANAGSTLQNLVEAWPQIRQTLARETGDAGTVDASMTEERAFGFDAVRIRAALPLAGDAPIVLQAEGTAFFRENDVLEVWTLTPDEASRTALGLSPTEWETDQSAMEQLLASFDFGSSADGAAESAREKTLTEDAIAYEDPAGAFSLMIPAKTRIITQATDSTTVADCRALYAANDEDGGKVFDQWMDDVTTSDCTLMLLPEDGLAWQIFCEDEESFRNATLSSYYRLAEPVRASLEERFGSALLLRDDDSALLSGLKHAKLVYWLRTGQTDAALEVYAITDENQLLRELDLFTMMDVKADKERQDAVTQMIRDTLTYRTPVPEKDIPSKTSEPAAD